MRDGPKLCTTDVPQIATETQVIRVAIMFEMDWRRLLSDPTFCKGDSEVAHFVARRDFFEPARHRGCPLPPRVFRIGYLTSASASAPFLTPPGKVARRSWLCRGSQSGDTKLATPTIFGSRSWPCLDDHFDSERSGERSAPGAVVKRRGSSIGVVYVVSDHRQAGCLRQTGPMHRRRCCSTQFDCSRIAPGACHF